MLALSRPICAGIPQVLQARRRMICCLSSSRWDAYQAASTSSSLPRPLPAPTATLPGVTAFAPPSEVSSTLTSSSYNSAGRGRNMVVMATTTAAASGVGVGGDEVASSSGAVDERQYPDGKVGFEFHKE